jgi:6-pyruvoyltetrahydropterin/6-carboxytetrahydropterin synthase
VTVQEITVKHNMEMAHRLWLTPGKCQQIHGHSWWVTLGITGEVDANGLLLGINYTDLKRVFRAYMDRNFDHHLLLHTDDIYAMPFRSKIEIEEGSTGWRTLPGLRTFKGDPTTENLAATIGQQMQHELMNQAPDILAISVLVQETAVNAAKWSCNESA